MRIRLLAFLTCVLSLRAQENTAPPGPPILQGKVEVEIDGKKEMLDLSDPAIAMRFKDKVIVVTEINGVREVRVMDAKDAEKLPVPFLWNEKPPVRTGPVTFLGIGAVEVPADVAAQLTLPQDTGLQIAVVLPDSPAAKAGLQESDIVQKFEDQILVTPRQLAVLIANRKEGDAVKFSIFRKGAPMEVTATLGKREAPHMVESKEKVANVMREMVKLEGDSEKAQALLKDMVLKDSKGTGLRLRIGSGGRVEMDALKEKRIAELLKGGYEVTGEDEKKPADTPAGEDTGKAIRDALDKLPAEERTKIIKDLLKESDALPKDALPEQK